MKGMKYRCIECGHVMFGNKDGARCDKCNAPIVPIDYIDKNDPDYKDWLNNKNKIEIDN